MLFLEDGGRRAGYCSAVGLDCQDGARSDNGVMHTGAKLGGVTLRGAVRREGEVRRKESDSCVLQYRLLSTCHLNHFTDKKK